MTKICMIVPDDSVKGGIATVVRGYRSSRLIKEYNIVFIESYIDGTKFQKLIKGIKAYIMYIRLLWMDKPEIIHIHSSFGASFYRKIPFVLLSKWNGVAIINHIHGSEIDKFYFQAGNAKKWIVKKIYGYCDCIIVLADYWREQFGKIISLDRVKTVGNYTPNIGIVDRKRKRQILYLGVIEKEKGCFNIPEIILRVRESDSECKFVLAGTGKTDEVKMLMRDHGVMDSVDFTGWVTGEEKRALLEDSMVFLLPSYHEGMPMSILEAMGYGMPIVSTMVGGVPDLVKHGVNGFLFHPDDIEGMSAALIKILSDDNLYKEMSVGSLEIVQSEFTLEQHIRKLEDIYRQLGAKGEVLWKM